ncbi:DgyrCDS13583 [Dimorphilus gyrociliatus]|uniref:DgyrCDS13583 n=1 Tax=Dimorphilus gyrociliatus TaxID=2664684 RepID=A0A7I8WB39_9ANNE|nr:DgyrCDS13583 [Dimorphilus gyrociliatus]
MKIFLSFSFWAVTLFLIAAAKDEDWEDIDVVAVNLDDDTKGDSENEVEASLTTTPSKVSPDACPVLNCDKICPCGKKTDSDHCYICECECNHGDKCEHECEFGRKISSTGELTCECHSEQQYIGVCKAFCHNIHNEAKNCEICPHCNCNGQVNNCPTLECNTVCKYGYTRDYNDCPSCNCQRGPDHPGHVDPCYHTRCDYGQICKVIAGNAVCVGHPSPITTLPPLNPPQCPKLTCGPDCTCEHFIRDDGCTVCQCANACYGVACPYGTICIPYYVFEAYTGKLQVTPNCRKVE